MHDQVADGQIGFVDGDVVVQAEGGGTGSLLGGAFDVEHGVAGDVVDGEVAVVGDADGFIFVQQCVVDVAGALPDEFDRVAVV
ncbi:hypothetical protein [Streptomyces sp. NPDC126514]|uniref:hypothetical protein n=1 Tax=Streptomyces sp. NPDC126514 TaxID=3155210 RepID=UPI003319B4A3